MNECVFEGTHRGLLTASAAVKRILRVVRSYSLRMFVGMNTMFAQLDTFVKEKQVQVKFPHSSCKVCFDYSLGLEKHP